MGARQILSHPRDFLELAVVGRPIRPQRLVEPGLSAEWGWHHLSGLASKRPRTLLFRKGCPKMSSPWLGLKSVLVLGLAAVLTASPLSASPAHATTFSNEGTEFYVTFNWGLSSNYDQMIYLSARQSGTVTIDWPIGPDTTHSVAANTTVAVDATGKGIYSQVTNEETSSRSARISSTVPISVYGAMLQFPDPHGGASSEAFTAIPTAALGTSYRLLGQRPISAFRGSEFSVVATEDATTVSITPSAPMGNSRTANNTFTVNLSRGQVYTAVAPDTSGITGTLVTSNKKVVVTSAAHCADLSGSTCDHLIEYMHPIDSWGSSFLLPGSLNRQPFNAGPPPAPTGDVYEILAHQDGTVVAINGIDVANLNAGQTYRHLGTTQSGVQRVDAVQTSKPVLIGHFLLQGDYGVTDVDGDPSFSLVIPTLQFLKQYNVATPTTGFRLHSLTLITLTSSVSTVRLNGAQIPAEYGTFSPIAGSDNSFARLQVPAGSYSLSSSTGLGVYGSGFDNDISYAYPAGFGLVNLVEYPGGADTVPSDEGGGGGGAGGDSGGGGTGASPAQVKPPTLAETGPDLSLVLVGSGVSALLLVIGAAATLASRRKLAAS